MNLSQPSMMGNSFVIITILNMILFMTMIGCSIYAFILFVKLARRGIKALDIYIDKNQNNLSSNEKLKDYNS